MTDEEQKIVFSRNLRKYLSGSGKSQLEVANAIGVSPQTFNTWINCKALPRMGKIQKLADYFKIKKSDLLDDKIPADQQYYSDQQTQQIAQAIFDDPDLHALFDAARDSKPEDLKMAADMLKRFKETNPDG